jgi:hypothetical protein
MGEQAQRGTFSARARGEYKSQGGVRLRGLTARKEPSGE